MPKDQKYVIVGFPKCGQNSLEKYLKDLGYEVARRDIIWRSNSRELIEQSHPDHKIIILMRDPVQMIWSSYWYWHYKDTMPFQAFLRYRSEKENTLGYESPMDHADYRKHIKKFEDLDPIILKFEDLVKIDGFPHENKTWAKPSLPNYYVEMILGALERNEVPTPDYPEEARDRDNPLRW